MAISSTIGWKVTGALVGAAAGVATRAVLSTVWRTAAHREPPENPASPSTSWPDALAWSIVSGVGLGVARLVAQRGAAAAWQAGTGSLPLPVRESGTAA